MTTTEICALVIDDQPKTIRGWIETIRKMKTVSFLIVRSGYREIDRVQVVVPKALISDFSVESYVSITGSVKQTPVGSHTDRGFEFIASSIQILGKSDESFSSRCPRDAGPDVKLKERHLYLRDHHFSKITVLRSLFIRSIRSYFESKSMTEIFPPTFVGTQCEGGATLFKVQHPGETEKDIPAYLTQSSQFYLEMALPALGDVFCIDKSYRAESSHTRRHLTEFIHAECEWSGIFSLEDHIEKLKDLMKGIITHFLAISTPLLEELGLIERVRKLSHDCDDILILTHKEAIDYTRAHLIYKDPDTQTFFEYEDDIPEAQERKLIDELGKIVFLTKFPTAQKSFYMKEDPEDPYYAWGVDVEVVGVGEVIGSGVRVSDPDVLRKRLREHGLSEDDYKEYIDLRTYGSGMTSGMGLGVDRFFTWLTDSYSIREVVTFPRYPGRLFP